MYHTYIYICIHPLSIPHIIVWGSCFPGVYSRPPCAAAASPPHLLALSHTTLSHTHTNLSHNSCTHNSVTQSSFMQSVFHHLLYLSLSCLSHPISTCCAYWKKSTCRVLRSFNLKDSGKSPSNYVDHGPLGCSQPAGFPGPGGTPGTPHHFERWDFR